MSLLFGAHITVPIHPLPSPAPEDIILLDNDTWLAIKPKTSADTDAFAVSVSAPRSITFGHALGIKSLIAWAKLDPTVRTLYTWNAGTSIDAPPGPS